VAIVATGDELVELDEPMEAWQIRNSNSYALAALVNAEGGVGERLAVARDILEELRAQVAEGREAELLLLSGGVSMGKYDLVEQVLREAGAEFFFTGALIQPGKPVVFGRIPKGKENSWTYFFGLPGNPVSTQVCFHLFVAPMLRALGGRTGIAPRFVEATLAEDVKSGGPVTRFLPAELSGAWDAVTVRRVGWQGSGDMAANARGNCYVVLPAGVEEFQAGETVRVLLR
jgi:molybdopterin molybdotransferase